MNYSLIELYARLTLTLEIEDCSLSWFTSFLLPLLSFSPKN